MDLHFGNPSTIHEKQGLERTQCKRWKQIFKGCRVIDFTYTSAVVQGHLLFCCLEYRTASTILLKKSQRIIIIKNKLNKKETPQVERTHDAEIMLHGRARKMLDPAASGESPRMASDEPRKVDLTELAAYHRRNVALWVVLFEG